jgi:hypothetical protein
LDKFLISLTHIQQLADKPVVTLKAHFFRLFASLEMRGITIHLALQVGFMLGALWSGYQAVVQEFCLGLCTLTSTMLQTVVNQCISYNKDPLKDSVGQDGKPVCTVSANMAGSNVDQDSATQYDALAAKPYNYHLNCWWKSLTGNKGK